MKMSKTLPLIVIASMMLSLVPSSMAVSLTISLSSTFGYVGDKVTVSGTLISYNGRYWIIQDINGDSILSANGTGLGNDWWFGPFTANGYAYSQEITIQDTTYGGRRIWVLDEQSSGSQVVSDFYTVQTSFTMDVDKTYSMEGGAPVVATGAIKGAPALWNNSVDLRIKITNPSGTSTVVVNASNIMMLKPGRISVAWDSGVQNNVLGCNPGLYTASLERNDTVTTPIWTFLASDTFTVGILGKSSYMRTETIIVEARAPATDAFTKVELKDPTGTVIATVNTVTAPGNWLGQTTLYVTGKTTTMGTYTVNIYNGTKVVKTQSTSLDKAYFVIAVNTYLDTWSLPITGSVAVGAEVERMHTVRAQLAITYPGGANVGIADLLSGFTAYFYYNDTQVAPIVLDPLVSFTAPNLWTVSYKVPKDAVVGSGYHFKVLAQSLTDSYGNAGPKDIFNTTKFAVKKGTLFTTGVPLQIYPGPGNAIQRTLEAKATLDVRYADNSRMVGTDIGVFNVTLVGPTKQYTLQMASSSYLDTVGIWMATWKSPYNAEIGQYRFNQLLEDIEDLWGNHGPTASVAAADTFNVSAATITVSEVGTNAATYLSDQEVTVSWKATYPSGDSVTTKATGYNIVKLIDANGVNFANATGGTYNEATGKWSVKYLLPLTLLSGTYNATIGANMVRDDATVANMGPTTQKFTNFDITRISLLDVYNMINDLRDEVNATNTQISSDVADALTAANDAKTAAADAKDAASDAKAAADAAKAAADAAGTTAGQAKTAADAAKAAADAAGTTAGQAKTAADAATAAANSAKTAAEAAKASADSQTTLIYVAIGASLVAAIAAIYAVMQISRKIA